MASIEAAALEVRQASSAGSDGISASTIHVLTALILSTAECEKPGKAILLMWIYEVLDSCLERVV